MPVNPNPQGKGLVPVLQGLQQHWSRIQVPPKQIDQISVELFTSLFILQSEFKFSPVPLRSYWLYQVRKRYRLLMVGPQEWHTPYPGRFIGRCRLQNDRTWTLDLDPLVAQDEAFLDTIEGQRRALEAELMQAPSLDEVMPGCIEALGYQGRALAYILGRSLRASMQLSGIHALTYSEAKGLLSFDNPEIP